MAVSVALKSTCPGIDASSGPRLSDFVLQFPYLENGDNKGALVL